MQDYFPASELILNQDGSVYHLNLRPEELADTVITVGDPDRVPKVSAFFDTLEVKKQKREFVTHTGTYKGKRITVLSTGIGTDNVEIAFHELDALVNIDLKSRKTKPELRKLNIIRIGTSGSLHESIPPDSFVFSAYGLGFDGLLNFYKVGYTEQEKSMTAAFLKHYGDKPNLAKPYIFKGSEKLQQVLSEGMFKGITVTCSGFYAPQGRILRYELAYPDIINLLPQFSYGDVRITNFEMETSAMYGLGRLLGHEVCAVNAIVANRITKKYSEHHEEAMEKLIRTVLDRIAGNL